jgi:hypothetical protein
VIKIGGPEPGPKAGTGHMWRKIENRGNDFRNLPRKRKKFSGPVMKRVKPSPPFVVKFPNFLEILTPKKQKTRSKSQKTGTRKTRKPEAKAKN